MTTIVQTHPRKGRRGRRTTFLIALATLAGVGAYALWGSPSPRHHAAARVAAWTKVTPRLAAAEQAGQQTASRHRELVRAFFAERKQRARAFAEEVLSLEGKWEFLKSKLPFTDAGGHNRFLRQRFAEMVVSGKELEGMIQTVVTSYLSELQGIENDLLVSIRADLGDGDLAPLQADVVFRTDEAFRREYARALEQVAGTVGRDLGVQVGREAVSWVAADIAASITVSLIAALAERLGISAGILGSGAASGVATLGIGIAAGFLIDALLDLILKECGHDPAGDIANKVCQALDTFEGILLDGNPEAWRTCKKLRRMQRDDPFPFVRDECRRAADKIETGGHLGLRAEMKRLREIRSKQREAALKRLILEGGGS